MNLKFLNLNQIRKIRKFSELIKEILLKFMKSGKLQN